MMADQTEFSDAQRQRNNVVVVHICPTKMSRAQEKRYSGPKKNEIVQAVNALYNSGGGTLLLRYIESTPPGHVKKCMSIVGEKIQEFLGTITRSFDIHITKVDSLPSQAHGEIKVVVESSTKSTSMIVLKYNIYLPSSAHVTEVSPLEGKKLRALLMESTPSMDPVEANTHQRNFVKGEHVSFDESSTIQFKYLKDKQEEKVTFADRLVGKSSKFRSYVSAFANFRGGHIYFGIKDDGEIVGESVDETGKQHVKKNIRKAINEMIWPTKSEPDGGNEDKRWHVYFEQVQDAENNIVEDLYVVVVFVAQCRGGVFAEEPECYKIIDNEVQKVDFASWKKGIESPLTQKGTCSPGASCDSVYEMLTNLLNNNCDGEELKEASDNIQKKYKVSNHDVKPNCLATFVNFHLRRGEYERAEAYFEEYKTIQPRCENQMRFKVMGQYLSSVIKSCKGEYEEGYKILKGSLEDLETLPFSITSAAFYVQIATLENILAMKTKGRREMQSLIKMAEKSYDTASSHLNQSQGHKITKADYLQRIYINKALLYLGCSISGDMLDDGDELINVNTAKNYLLKTQEIIHEGYPLCKFRKVQNLLAQACLSYRLRNSDLTQQLQNAVNYSTAAAHLAKTCEFAEMLRYSERYKNFFEKSGKSKR